MGVCVQYGHACRASLALSSFYTGSLTSMLLLPESLCLVTAETSVARIPHIGIIWPFCVMMSEKQYCTEMLNTLLDTIMSASILATLLCLHCHQTVLVTM